MRYRPRRAPGLAVGGLLALWALGSGLLLLGLARGQEPGPAAFLAWGGAAAALLLAPAFAFWTWSLATLSYAIDRNALVIRFGPSQQVVPLGSIERLVAGEAAGVPRVRGLDWWGCHVGRARLERIGPVLFYSAHRTPAEVLYVVTPDGTYALSVADPDGFAREILRRQGLGPTAPLERHARHGVLAPLALWNDPRARALAGLAIAAAALAWLQLALRYGAAPEAIALPWRAGAVEEAALAPRSALLEAPRAATAILAAALAAAALLHHRERVAGYLVLGAAIAVQAICFAALWIALG